MEIFALKEVIEQIKSLPISKIIKNFIQIDEVEGKLLAACPWCRERSLVVNDKKGLFMCPICQIGGDAITFVEKYNKVDFREAVKIIEKSGGLMVKAKDLIKVINQDIVNLPEKIEHIHLSATKQDIALIIDMLSNALYLGGRKLVSEEVKNENGESVFKVQIVG